MNEHSRSFEPRSDRARGALSTLTGEYDVIVVGARAAGAATAMLLARRGLSVLVVDRAEYGSDTVSTHSLAPAGVLQLSRWGVLDAVRAAGTPTTSRVEFRYGQDAVALDFPPRGDVDGLYSPRRTVLDRILVDTADAAGADVRHRVTVTEVTRDPAGRVDGVVLRTDDEVRRVRARWVVGADGVRSRVARDVGAETVARADHTIAAVYSYWEGLPTDAVSTYYDPARVVGMIPTNGATLLWAGMRPDEFARVGRGDPGAAHRSVVERRPEVSDLVSGARRTSRFAAWPGIAGHRRRAWGAGWVLVGDAGYFKDPVTAHGITDAFIGAELVAEAIARIAHDGAAERDALGHYETVRDEMAAALDPGAAMAAALPDDVSQVAAGFVRMSAALRAEWSLVETEFGALVGC